MFVHCKEKNILEEIRNKIAQSNANAMNLSMAIGKSQRRKKLHSMQRKKMIGFTSMKAKMK